MLKLNYETYKQLSPELKEEYDWKFKNYKCFQPWQYNNVLLWLGAIMIIISFTTYIFITNAELSVYKESILDIFTKIFDIYYVFIWILVVFFIYDFYALIKHLYNFHKWKKDNNINRIVKKQWWKFLWEI